MTDETTITQEAKRPQTRDEWRDDFRARLGVAAGQAIDPARSRQGGVRQPESGEGTE